MDLRIGIRDWTKRVVIHDAGRTPKKYRKAVYDTLLVNRLVLIETSSEHIKGRSNFFMAATKPLQIGRIVRKDGQHPKPIKRAAMQ